ncbi:hypothetical protein BC832DRAFT_336346 [Gaertneriomyces semiglobifer]|nr:hypothetical protein BC832DRAFT_336346 [Gaertneriomyces semiglobifer]
MTGWSIYSLSFAFRWLSCTRKRARSICVLQISNHVGWTKYKQLHNVNPCCTRRNGWSYFIPPPLSAPTRVCGNFQMRNRNRLSWQRVRHHCCRMHFIKYTFNTQLGSLSEHQRHMCARGTLQASLFKFMQRPGYETSSARVGASREKRGRVVDCSEV